MAVKPISDYSHNSFTPYDGSEGTKFLDARLAGAIKRIQDEVNAARENTPWVFFVRTHGDANPVAEKFIGNQEDIKVVGRHMKMAWAKTKDDYKICRGGRIDCDVDGNPIAIDGTDGDLISYFDTEMHHYENKWTVEGVTFDIFGLGLYEITLYGKQSEAYPASGMFCDRAVIYQNASHCFYNQTVPGTAGSPNGMFLQNILPANGMGLATQNQSCLGSMLYAQNKNEDNEHGDGWYGLHYMIWQMWFMLQAIEIGSVYTCNPTVDKETLESDPTKSIEKINGLGYGITAMTEADANFQTPEAISTAEIYLANGTLKGTVHVYTNCLRLAAGGANTSIIASIDSQGYNFIPLLEPQRVANAFVKYGQQYPQLLQDLTDHTTHDNYITLAADGCTVESVVQVNKDQTPANMVPGKPYYTLHNVKGCEGILDGVLTCVVNKYVKLEFSSAACYSDDTSLAGGYAVVKFSMPIYRGVTFNIGSFIHTCGFHFVTHGQESGGSTSYWLTQIKHKLPTDLPKITGTGADKCYGAESSTPQLAEGAEEITDHLAVGSGWMKETEWKDSFFSYRTAGAAVNTYECAYTWRDGHCYGAGDASSYPESGKKCVLAAVLGCCANGGDPSARAARCNRAASYAYVYYCSAAALIGIGMPEA